MMAGFIALQMANMTTRLAAASQAPRLVTVAHREKPDINSNLTGHKFGWTRDQSATEIDPRYSVPSGTLLRFVTDDPTRIYGMMLLDDGTIEAVPYERLRLVRKDGR